MKTIGIELTLVSRDSATRALFVASLCFAPIDKVDMKAALGRGGSFRKELMDFSLS